MPPCLPSTAKFQKQECRSYLGVNLKFMTSARSTLPESVTQQVCWGGYEKEPGREELRMFLGIPEGLSPEHRVKVGPPLCFHIAVL